MTKEVQNSKMLSRAFTAVSLVTLIFALSVTGALGGFWRTLNGIDATGVPNPADFLFGQGTDGTSNGLFGYGYGYGYGNFAAGNVFTGSTSSSSSGGSSSTTSSSGSSSGSSSSSSSSGSSSSSSGSSSSSSSGGSSSSSSSSSGSSSGSSSSSSSSGSSSSSSGSSSSSSSSSSSGGGETPFTQRTYEDEPKIPTCGTSIVSFSDISGNTFEQYIIDLEKVSGLNGNGDGSNFAIYTPESKEFQPNRAATRSEYLKMVLRALCIDYSEENSTLDDFSDSGVDAWQAKVVNKAADLGLINTSNSTFRVNDPISRIEALKIVMLASVLDPLATPTTSSFSDVASGSWESKYTEAALSYGIIAPNTNYRPSAAITRGESTKLIMRTLHSIGY